MAPWRTCPAISLMRGVPSSAPIIERKNIHAIPRDTAMHLLETLDPERWKPKKAKGRKKKDAYASGGMILLTSYDTFRRDASLYEGIRFRNVFLDEAQSVKNAFSQLWLKRNVKALQIRI